ncbi:antigen 5 like allergen Cul n 1-like [Phlebotomus papatasi]|uniref:antigen 5 like allergen Cul n 1-like n=1 Tax=Phlebotomus papatasi TaxID=29031 RepID=UPI0024833A47|nr:antigen 5 like allergen Cul n 1-like [Phlebotomus papatasi]
MKLLVVAFAIFVASSEATDWCAMEDEYCNGQEHIMCKPNSFTMGQNVRNIQMVEMTADLIQVAEDRHNFHRSNVASGSVDGIPSASAMRKMVWDEDLELVAAEHACYANFEHDQCRSSTEYPHAGQNLAVAWSSVPFTNIAQQFESFIDDWYNEMPIVRDGRLSCIDSFTTSNPNCMDAGHFTAMVNDINGFLGCALVTYEEDMGGEWWYAIMATCDYQGTNMIGDPVYVTGTPCSQCAADNRVCDATTSLCV